ncbi:MAG: PorV/PorQ family protein [Candidatus Zixiibacteriota bacterium]
MKMRKAIVSSLALIFVLMAAVDGFADVSSAAVLFLRIAAGSRASAMGESFVAVADDGTTTHWNPAGLGSYPLADDWIENSLPDEYRPVTAFAAIPKNRSGLSIDYDIWALTSKGLVRFDGKNWESSETFDTKTDDELQKVIASYFNTKDDAKLVRMVTIVAEANSKRTLQEMTTLKENILAAIPADYKHREGLLGNLDSLMVKYNECKLKWEKVEEIESQYKEAMKDSLMNIDEAEKIYFAVEKSWARWIPEEIKVPYNVFFDSDLKMIASAGDKLLVGTSDGLVAFNGKSWQSLTVENGLPSNNILTFCTSDQKILVGTDSGLVVFDGFSIDTTSLAGCPAGTVTAIGADGLSSVYAVVDNDLYHFDGSAWSNSFVYTLELEDTPEKIAEKFSVYGTETEKEKYLAKLETLKTPPAPVEPEVEADTTGEAAAEGEAAEVQPEVAEATPEKLDVAEMRIPFLAEFKGRVTSIYVAFDETVWVGTDYGILSFNGESWQMPGYKDYTVREGETFENLIAFKENNTPDDAELYAAQLMEINDLPEKTVKAGDVMKIYSNPAALPVNGISRHEKKIMFATPEGMIEYGDGAWSRSGALNLGSTEIVGISSIDNEVMVMTDERIVVRAKGRTELTFMHVKWLKELADDMYYEFLSFVTSKGDLGTFGGNITYITYGSFIQTTTSPDEQGQFDAFDLAITLAYGNSLTRRLKYGLSAKLIHSHLSPIGAGKEQGDGISWGFAVDFGLLYHMTPRLNWGLAITNIGPKMQYIDAGQSDDLPRNLSFGFAYKLIQTDYYKMLVTGELNKILVSLDDGLSEEFREMVISGGGEFTYADLLAARAGYYYDKEGQLKYLTLGLGLTLKIFKFDFAYIPNNDDIALANTLRMSFSVLL